jgi:hypothetical protein
MEFVSGTANYALALVPGPNLDFDGGWDQSSSYRDHWYWNREVFLSFHSDKLESKNMALAIVFFPGINKVKHTVV